MTINLEISCDYNKCKEKIRHEDCNVEPVNRLPLRSASRGNDVTAYWDKLYGDLVAKHKWKIDHDYWRFYCPSCALLAEERKEEEKQGL